MRFIFLFFLAVIMGGVLTGCRVNGSAQDEMFAGKHEKSAWYKKKRKKKQEDFNPYVHGKKTKPSAVQAKENKKAVKRAKREIRREKRKLRRTKGAYQKVKSS